MRNKLFLFFFSFFLVSLAGSGSLRAERDELAVDTFAVFNDGTVLEGTFPITICVSDVADQTDNCIARTSQEGVFRSGVFQTSLDLLETISETDLPDRFFLTIAIEGPSGREQFPSIELTGVPWAIRARLADRALALVNPITASQIADGTITPQELQEIITPGTFTNPVVTVDEHGLIVAISNGTAGAGDITGVTAGTGLTGGGAAGDVTLSLANSGVTAGTYGSATQVPQIAVGADGRITGAANVAITGVSPSGAAGGDLTGTYPNPTIASNAVTTPKIADSAVSGAKIADDAVTMSKITANAVGTSEIADDAVTTAKIAADAVGTVEIASNAVTTPKIADSAVSGAKIADDTITDTKIAANAVGTSEIIDGTITATDLNATLTFLDGDYLDLSAILHDDTALQGLRLPQIGAAPSVIGAPGPQEGFIGWDQTNNTLEVFDGTNWVVLGTGSGDIDAVTAGTGLTGGGTSGSVTLDVGAGTGIVVAADSVAVDVGTTANKIVQLDGSARLPAVDGSQLTGVVVGDNTVTSAKIVDGAIVNADINSAAGIVDTKLATISTAGKVADSALSANVSLLGSSIDSSEIEDGTVAAVDIGTNAVGADEIATNAVGSDEIASDAVTSAEIASGAVGTDEIADDTIDFTDIADTLRLDATLTQVLFDATETLIFDAETTDTTNTSGAVQFLVDSGTDNAEAVTIDIQAMLTNTTGTEEVSGLTVIPRQGSTGVGGVHELYGIQLEAPTAVGTPTGTNLEYGIRVRTGYDYAGWFDSPIVATDNLNIGSPSGGDPASLVIHDNDGTAPESITINPPAGTDLTTSYTLTLPSAVASSNGQVLSSTTGGVLSWATVDTSTTNEAPIGSSYVVIGTDGTLTNERALSAGTGLTLTDGGAGGFAIVNVGAGSGISAAADVVQLGDLTTNWSQGGAFDIVLNNANSELLIMESAGNTFVGTLDAGDLSTARTWTLPDATGNLITTGDSGTVTGTMIANGTITSADISGTAAITDAQVSDTLTIGAGSTVADSALSANVSLLGTSISGGEVDDDTLDFVDFEDTLDLDANLTLNQGSNTWSQSFTGSTTTGLTYTSNSLTTGSALSLSATNSPTTDTAINPVNISLTNSQGTTANTNSYTGVAIDYNHRAAVATANESVARIRMIATGAITTDTTVASLLKLENDDTAAGTSIIVADGLLVEAVTNSFITDGVDVSDPEIDNAINIGANPIVTGANAGTLGTSATTSWTLVTDGTGDTEITLPTGSISGTEVLDDTLDFDDLQDTLDLDAGTEINLGTNNLTIDLDSTGDLVIADAGTATHIFQDDGRVGIGTTSPDDIFDVEKDGGIAYFQSPDVTVDNDTNDSVTVRLRAKYDSNSSGGTLTPASIDADLVHIPTLQGDSRLAVKVGGSERMSVLSSGRVGVGVSNPSNTLEVSGNIVATSGNRIGAGTTSPSNTLDVEGTVRLGFSGFTIDNNNVGGSLASGTLNPTTSFVIIDCLDPDGCNVTMGETGPPTIGQIVTIVNETTPTVNFADTSGVSELAGAFAAGQWDSISMIYLGSRWVEVNRSNN